MSEWILLDNNGCLLHPCLNGGTCNVLSLTDGSYYCSCCNGFSGNNCQIRNLKIKHKGCEAVSQLHNLFGTFI